jgi:hypothetical protein
VDLLGVLAGHPFVNVVGRQRTQHNHLVAQQHSHGGIMSPSE